MEQADLHVHEFSQVDVPMNRSVNQDKVFTDDPEGVFNYLPRISSDHTLRTGPDPNSSRSTVVAFRAGNRITDTGPTYARKHLEPERSKDRINDIRSNDSRMGTVDIDLSQAFSDVLLRSMGLQLNPQPSLNRNSNFSDTWMNSLQTKQALQDERLENLSQTVTTISIALQGADSVSSYTKQKPRFLKP